MATSFRPHLSRRGALRRLSAVAAIPAVNQFLPAADLTASASSEKFLIGACDWTLGKTANPESLTLAKELGLDGVQVDFGHEPDAAGRLPLESERLQDQFLAAEAAGPVKIPSLAMGVLNRVALKKDSEAEKWVLGSVAVCRRMKKKIVLLAFFGNGDLQNDRTAQDLVISKLKKLAPRAEEAGVVYGIESWLHVSVLERMLDAIKSPAIQVYYDVGNMHKVSEDIYAAIPKLGRERICEFHMKDYDDLYGKGSIDFPKVRRAMDAIRYRGWMHIEGVKMPLGLAESVKYDAEYLRKVFAV